MTPEIDERTIAGHRVRIDRALCVGFGDCIDAAPEAFRLDEEGLAVFVSPETTPAERLRRACESCPVDALTLWDGSGRQLVPDPGTPLTSPPRG